MLPIILYRMNMYIYNTITPVYVHIRAYKGFWGKWQQEVKE